MTGTPRDPSGDPRRRVAYLMLFRIGLVSVVFGSLLMLSWWSDSALGDTSTRLLFGLIAATYVLTVVYAVMLRRGTDPARLASLQIAADLAIASVLVHATGGAQSPYSFFFPLSIIGAAIIWFRTGAAISLSASIVLYVAVSLLGWWGILPPIEGTIVLPSDLTQVELLRALALNIATFLAVGALVVNLAGQLARTSAVLETEREGAAILRTVHEDIVRSLAGGLITVDNNGAVLTINDAACEILAVSFQASKDKPIQNVVPALGAHLENLGPRAVVRRLELTLDSGEGDGRTLGISITPLLNHQDGVLGRIINFQDLTELRAVERRARQGERLAAIGRLAAGIAHEIRNPLASISGSIELLAAAPAEADDDERALMDIVTREIDRLNHLLTDLLEYANPRPRQAVPVEVPELCAAAVRAFEKDPRAAAVTVRVDPGDGDAPLVSTDPSKLEQVLWNLLRNAAEAGASHITIATAAAGDRAIITVSDDGPGIPAASRDRLFEPFFTTKRHGTGLGLATAFAIITEHAGTIEATERAAGGTEFSITLPIHPGGANS
ncbi:MAG TPA: ATP-binding protein [Kofleriaceae bacterium]|nr:ATP-binding protein [Kofleriaceae bacterium]